MNWPAKQVRQWLLIVTIALFFSCEDDKSLLRFDDPKPKFNVSFIEIPVGSSMMLFDSIKTANYYRLDEVMRWVVGTYNDPVFGEVTSEAYSQFLPLANIETDSVPVFDSLMLQLKFDYYLYGYTGTALTLNVREITSYLQVTDSVTVQNNSGAQNKPVDYPSYPSRYYYSNTPTDVSPDLIGTKTFTVDPTEFEDSAKVNGTTLLTFKLDGAFGQRLYDYAISKGTATDFLARSVFAKQFNGLAFSIDANDRVIGFDPSSALTKLTLYYHKTTANDSARTLTFTFNSSIYNRNQSNLSNFLVSYNKITTDRSGSDISYLTVPYQEDSTSSDLRYVQAGTGVVTKLNFSKFFEFADSIPNMIINSATLYIEAGDDTFRYKPPQSLILQALDNNNRPKKATSLSVTGAMLDAYWNNIYTSDQERMMPAIEDYIYTVVQREVSGGRSAHFNFNTDNNAYNGFMTLHMQEQYLTEPEKRNLNYFLAPAQSRYASTNVGVVEKLYLESGKSLNRVVFHKDNIKLRIYYTRPTF